MNGWMDGWNDSLHRHIKFSFSIFLSQRSSFVFLVFVFVSLSLFFTFLFLLLLVLLLLLLLLFSFFVISFFYYIYFIYVSPLTLSSNFSFILPPIQPFSISTHTFIHSRIHPFIHTFTHTIIFPPKQTSFFPCSFSSSFSPLSLLFLFLYFSRARKWNRFFRHIFSNISRAGTYFGQSIRGKVFDSFPPAAKRTRGN